MKIREKNAKSGELDPVSRVMRVGSGKLKSGNQASSKALTERAENYESAVPYEEKNEKTRVI